MSSHFAWVREKPIYLLLAVNILVGLFVFRSYGLSWDEPLFYDYADALGYAYSPDEWLSGTFDLNNSYGRSGDDHKTRGPAYLFLARQPVYLLEGLGLDAASAWHLINFLCFQLGVYFLYRLSLRWVPPAAALAAAALFSSQPLLWGHAFLNPKDPPFLVFFLGSVCLGFEMVDQIVGEAKSNRQKYTSVLLAGVFLGITTSIRVLGPLAGLLVLAYFLTRVGQEQKRLLSTRGWGTLVSYGGIALAAMLITWPYLWENPLARFIEVFRLMSDNPTTLSVLFGGEIYRAGELPRRYFPFMLVTTLTEPVWPLFVSGVFIAYGKLFTEPSPTKTNKLMSFTLTLLWFIILALYVLIRRPSMYDGVRHFLFILPPIFITAGFAFEYLFGVTSSVRLRAGLAVALIFPGWFGILNLHPYEYTYYNSFVGGTSAAFRNYETDYWLTCYQESVERLDERLTEPFTLFVHREAYIAEYYADAETTVRDLRGAVAEVQSGDYVLVNTRTNEDRRVFREAPIISQIGRGEAVFCITKRIP